LNIWRGTFSLHFPGFYHTSILVRTGAVPLYQPQGIERSLKGTTDENGVTWLIVNHWAGSHLKHNQHYIPIQTPAMVVSYHLMSTSL
jgi:hypothetical protein